MFSQLEIDLLLKMSKKLKSNHTILFPYAGEEVKLDVESKTTNDKFIIDINRKGQINISRCTYQTRYQKSIVLLRKDIKGSPHTNPNGDHVPCPHIHMYKEGFESRWAFPLDKEIQVDPNNLTDVLIHF